MQPGEEQTSPIAEGGQPGRAEVEEALARLKRSRQLRESHQLQTFLDYAVNETLEGRTDSLKEYLVGCRVFGRKADYDPRQDGIVRVQATTLRKRLEKYYLGEGAGDAVVIELPRGGYVPHFRYTGTPALAAPPATPASTGWAWRPFLAGAAAMGVIALLLALPWGQWFGEPSKGSAAAAEFPELWKPFIQRGANNLVAYGVPLFYSAGGLYFRDVEINGPQDMGHGPLNTVFESMKLTPQVTDDTYTGVGEVEGTHLVSDLLTAHGAQVRVANARTLGQADLPGHNLFVISSLRFQTLLINLKLPSDFEFGSQRPETIINLRPLPGEKQRYSYEGGAGVATSYAMVSVWPGATNKERIVHVGGIHTWSTQAATEFLLDREKLRKLSREFAADRKSGRRRAISPFFQILLRVEGRGNQRQRVDYVTHHYLRPSAR